FEIKGRPTRSPLIVHVSDEDMARSVARAWPEEAGAIAGAFWPGPVSIIVPRADGLPEVVTGGGATVAVRCPDHPMALALIRALGGPIVAPSANLSGELSPTRAEHVRASFTEDEVLVLDGGACASGIESTVVSLVDRPARVLRRGVISADRLSTAIGREVVEVPAAMELGDRPGGGLSGAQYAPRSRVVLFEPGRFAHATRAVHGPIVALVITERPEVEPPGRVCVMPGDASAYARGLYEALRAADADAPAVIAVELPPSTEAEPDRAVWSAVLDLLRRVATPP
ncbi:MAG: threonylcarbamoyl-AMP synthase, partial [Planctomycetes bacterium]|nr:threonylcarbamoyl-AMP synthase [Planctomycetota bacterium]